MINGPLMIFPDPYMTDDFPHESLWLDGRGRSLVVFVRIIRPSMGRHEALPSPIYWDILSEH